MIWRSNENNSNFMIIYKVFLSINHILIFTQKVDRYLKVFKGTDQDNSFNFFQIANCHFNH